MNRWKKMVYAAAVLFLSISLLSCVAPKQTGVKAKKQVPTVSDEATIGSVATIVEANTIAVEGYNIVGGLNGTGSSECPAAIKEYLQKFIHAKLPTLDVDKFIAGHDTAIVKITGKMPTWPLSSQDFDVKVEALPGTQTTSLQGGILYGAELKIAKGFFGTLPVLGQAQGPIFINPLDSNANPTTGYVLGGGKRLATFNMSLNLKKPDFRMANFISNRLRTRFGDETANANSPGQISLSIPLKYAKQQERFIEIVKSMYLNESPQLLGQRIETQIQKLAASNDGQGKESEVALETLGKACIGKLKELLTSPDEMVRLRAGRCLLNLDSNLGLAPLRDITNDVKSSRRIEALKAICIGANKNDASLTARRLLKDQDFNIRFAAYTQLENLNDIAITKTMVSNDFNVELIRQAIKKDIYVFRSGQRKIVLFATPIECTAGTLVSSNDGNVTITADKGNKFVWIIRTHPTDPSKIIKIQSTFRLDDIIKTMCREPKAGGLGLSYEYAIELLKKMCDTKQVAAEFHAGPMPK